MMEILEKVKEWEKALINIYVAFGVEAFKYTMAPCHKSWVYNLWRWTLLKRVRRGWYRITPFGVKCVRVLARKYKIDIEKLREEKLKRRIYEKEKVE